MELVIKEYNKKKFNRLPPETNAEKIKQLRKEHEKLVKGRFDFVDAQGGWLEFAYRFFREDPLVTMKLVHGQIYELPAGVVKHLNNTKKKIRKMVVNLDPNARGVSSTFEIQSRVNFIPMEAV